MYFKQSLIPGVMRIVLTFASKGMLIKNPMSSEYRPQRESKGIFFLKSNFERGWGEWGLPSVGAQGMDIFVWQHEMFQVPHTMFDVISLVFYFCISAVLRVDSSESIVGIKSKDVLDKIAAILRTVTSNLDIE